MHITDSQLALGSTHALQQQAVRNTTLERIEGTADAQAFSDLFEKELNQLIAARLHESAPIEVASSCRAPQQLHDMLETMLAMLFGPQARFTSSALSAHQGDGGSTMALDQASSSMSPSRPRWQITQLDQLSETESCQFSASGKVCLADGSERQFDVGFQFDRSEEVTRTVSRTLIDPLVVDGSAPRAALAATSAEFDLNSDGKLEQMRLPGAGSAFLFLDRNHNGRADNGSELFGPETGNGFAELARLDGDNNGWIDSADPAFADLRLWQVDGSSLQVRSLNEAGIGALSTASVETPFALKEGGATLGQMRSSGVWLGETGGAGVVRQVDVGTTPVTEKKT